MTPEEAKSFDIDKLLGKPCKLLIQHFTGDDGKVRANIQAAIKPEPGQPTTAQNDLVVFDMSKPDAVMKSRLPEWIQKIIDKAVVTAKPAPVNASPEPAPFDDDLTF